MAVEGVVRWDRLRCERERDGSGGSEPYVWTALVAGTVDSFRTGEVHVVAPSVSDGARTLVKRGIRDGETVTMPAAQRRLVHRFADGEVGFLAAVALLLEDDGLPGNAVRAGYRTFLRKLKSELGAFLKEHQQAPDPHDVQELRDAIQPAVVGAMRRALSFRQTVWAVVSGNRDDFIGSDSAMVMVIGPQNPVPFTLAYERIVHVPAQVLQPSGAPPIVLTPAHDEVFHRYRIDGRFELTRP